MLLRLLAGLLIDDELADGDPPTIAGVRVVQILAAVWCCGEGIAGWRYSVLVHSALSFSVGRVPGDAVSAGPFCIYGYSSTALTISK